MVFEKIIPGVARKLGQTPVALSLRRIREIAISDYSPLEAWGHSLIGLNTILNANSFRRMNARCDHYLQEVRDDSRRTNDFALHLLRDSIWTTAVLLEGATTIALREPLILASSLAVAAAVTVRNLAEKTATTVTSLQTRA